MMGLSRAHIIAYSAGALATLAVLLMFIFFALSGWYEESTFSAVVQSVLIGAASKVGTELRARSKGENVEDVEALVSEVMSEQDEAATGD